MVRGLLNCFSMTFTIALCKQCLCSTLLWFLCKMKEHNTSLFPNNFSTLTELLSIVLKLYKQYSATLASAFVYPVSTVPHGWGSHCDGPGCGASGIGNAAPQLAGSLRSCLGPLIRAWPKTDVRPLSITATHRLMGLGGNMPHWQLHWLLWKRLGVTKWPFAW